jgi:acyl-coenzyme A synthetase/AMP-(fatty) acid ligase
MLSALAANGRVWLAGDNAAENVLRLIERERLAVVFCFPHTFLDMQDLGLQRYSLESVRMWLSAADSSHEAHIREFTRHGAFLRLFGRKVLSSMYVDSLGSSEVGFAAIVRMAFSFSRRYGRYVGRASSAGPRVKVADADGRPVRPGQTGRLMVKGPTLFKGYWNAHDKLHGVVKDGWWWTGDIGYAQGRGHFYHLDRARDVIGAAGRDVYSLRVEELLLKCPGVLEAVVFGRRMADGTCQPVAHVQPARGARLAAADVLQWANARLACAERLAQVRIVGREDIPRGLTGKVLKTAMRAALDAPETTHTTARTPGTAP